MLDSHEEKIRLAQHRQKVWMGTEDLTRNIDVHQACALIAQRKPHRTVGPELSLGLARTRSLLLSM